jgi:Fic family protein
MHVPLNRDAVLDAMPVLFDLLRDETDPAVRVVLGHFVFVYIHPYMDGNGRIGRLLMNLMMAADGYRGLWYQSVSARPTWLPSKRRASSRISSRSLNSWQALSKDVSRENHCRKCPRLPRDQVRGPRSRDSACVRDCAR